MTDIDGSTGEGGGQLLRTAVALSAITGRAVRLTRIRARRARPGLAAQHLAAVKAVATLCDAQVDGLELASQEVGFDPRAVRAGTHVFDVGTAGSITLVLQALLPVMLTAPERSRVRVIGGTDVRAAPPLDYLREVLLPLLHRIGARATVDVVRRGYFPRGGGEVLCEVEPSTLRPVDLADPGPLRSIDAFSHVSNLPAHIAQRMAAAARNALQDLAEPAVRVELLGPQQAIGPGGAIVLRARTAASLLGAGRVAQRGVPAERLGAEAATELRSDLACGAALDTHAADQLLVHLALAGAGSRFTTRAVTSHARTAMWLIERFLPVRFEVTEHRTLAGVGIVAAPGPSPPS
ncbi:MAG: RNA 3'-phosphate cyclase [Burkholderiales bacterium]|nr:MAG: RNA 3'-phosphate cyclase [Burkholderiales bacterium]